MADTTKHPQPPPPVRDLRIHATPEQLAQALLKTPKEEAALPPKKGD